jgi:hypothetical protein
MHDLYILNFLGMNDHAIFRVDDFHSEPGISLQDFKYALIFWQNVEESCMFQTIYGVEKVKLKIKWQGMLEKTQM